MTRQEGTEHRQSKESKVEASQPIAVRMKGEGEGEGQR